MDISLGERIVVPAVLAAIFALLSGGAMLTSGGATSRMKIVLRCSLLFVTGTLYCIAWHDKLASLLGWKDAWVGMAAVFAVGSVYVGGDSYVNSPNETPQISLRRILQTASSVPRLTTGYSEISG